jgi:CheY-like chemotaxis protein
MNNDKKRILLVDDEHDITFALSIGLENNGFVVDTFNDPQEALSNFKPGLYDLLLIIEKVIIFIICYTLYMIQIMTMEEICLAINNTTIIIILPLIIML